MLAELDVSPESLQLRSRRHALVADGQAAWFSPGGCRHSSNAQAGPSLAPRLDPAVVQWRVVARLRCGLNLMSAQSHCSRGAAATPSWWMGRLLGPYLLQGLIPRSHDGNSVLQQWVRDMRAELDVSPEPPQPRSRHRARVVGGQAAWFSPGGGGCSRCLDRTEPSSKTWSRDRAAVCCSSQVGLRCEPVRRQSGCWVCRWRADVVLGQRGIDGWVGAMGCWSLRHGWMDVCCCG